MFSGCYKEHTNVNRAHYHYSGILKVISPDSQIRLRYCLTILPGSQWTLKFSATLSPSLVIHKTSQYLYATRDHEIISQEDIEQIMASYFDSLTIDDLVSLMQFQTIKNSEWSVQSFDKYIALQSDRTALKIKIYPK